MVALQGCAGGPADDGPHPAAAQAPVAAAKSQVALRKGMKPEEVRQALGNPARIQPLEVPVGKAEKWIYVRGRKTETRQVVTGSKDVPYFDPFTNQTRMIPEPVYADEATIITEELVLFWHDGALLEWKTEYRTNRSYIN